MSESHKRINNIHTLQIEAKYHPLHDPISNVMVAWAEI